MVFWGFWLKNAYYYYIVVTLSNPEKYIKSKDLNISGMSLNLSDNSIIIYFFYYLILNLSQKNFFLDVRNTTGLLVVALVLVVYHSIRNYRG